MKVKETSLRGVLVVEPEPFQNGEGELFKDERGFFLETYSEVKYKKQDINVQFIEDDISVSSKNVLRGIHGDDRRWKLISCLYGKIFFVAVNCDEKSSDFGQWEHFDLDEENKKSILMPPMYGSSYLALSDKIIVHYKQSGNYDPGKQFRYKWNDPRFDIAWPIKDPILGERDK